MRLLRLRLALALLTLARISHPKRDPEGYGPVWLHLKVPTCTDLSRARRAEGGADA